MIDEATLRNAAPKTKPYRIYGQGIYAIVQPSGSIWLRQNIRRNGIQTTVSLGTFPQTSVAEALAERDRIRAQARMGIHPVAARRAARQGASLGSAGVAFSIALSQDGALSVTVGSQTLHLTRFQTDAIRAALLADH